MEVALIKLSFDVTAESETPKKNAGVPSDNKIPE